MMEAVESAVVETQPEELSDLAKAMLGADQVETPEVTPPVAEVETPTPVAEPDPESAPDEDAAPETEQAPKTIKALAEKLGVEASELYDIKVTMPDGAELSLGALKDQYQEADTLTTQRDTLDERRIAFDTEMSSKQAELDALTQVIDPSTLTPQVQAAYQDFVTASQTREAKAMLATTPEWNDPIQRESDQKLMTEFAAKFGMSEGALYGVKDHAVLRIIRDGALKNQRAVKTPPKGQKPTKKPVSTRNDLKTIVAEAKSGKRDVRQALGDVLRARG